MAQEKQQSETLTGTVYELYQGKWLPLEYAWISLPDVGISTATSAQGRYVLKGVPKGMNRVKVQFFGRVPIDTLVRVEGQRTLDFRMHTQDFKIKEIVVTAQIKESGKSSAAFISRTAMDHIQATSLNDLMALLPGGLSSNPTLSYSKQLRIRQVADGSKESALNALGSAIIRDGAPLSNNSNLSALNPTVGGGTNALAGGASPEGGKDLREISTDNIESVEVITGIPSVEYGDLTTGAVIIHSKAGREPLKVRGKVNPNVYQISLGRGLSLGKDAGTIHLSGDYAHNVNSPTSAYRHYQRMNAKALYSNSFLENKLQNHTTLDILYQQDQRDSNPDDTRDQISSKGKTYGLTLNTNGSWTLDAGWLRSIRYVLSQSVRTGKSFYERVYTVANAPYSGTLSDGTVLSNIPGKRIYDSEGNEITHLDPNDPTAQARYLPNDYRGRYDIDSKELNTFAKVSATFYKKWENVGNRLLLGADYRLEGNRGRGKTFSPEAPPYRDLSQKDATFRPRSYQEIPFVNQLGIYAEENIFGKLGKHSIDLQAGLRYDYQSKSGGILAPRVNASLEIIPHRWRVRGGYGVTAKMPTLLYLFPEKAYFEYINYSNLSNTNLPEDQKLFITTTRIFDADNHSLKIARNHKLELGTDLTLKKGSLHLNAYHEKLKDGYTLGQDFSTFRPVTYNVFETNKEGKLALKGAYPVLSDYYKPLNNFEITNEGIELRVNVNRIEAIRTAFTLDGAWMKSVSRETGYTFYDASSNAPQKRLPVGVYDESEKVSYRERASTTLRAIHNIPEIGFVISLAAEAVWRDKAHVTYGNDSIPVGYLELENGNFHPFKDGMFRTISDLKASEYSYLYRTASHSEEIEESYPPYFCFHMNLTKEVSDWLRISFFANNALRSYPRAESKRNPGTYAVFNNRFFFGLELSLTL